MDLFQRGQRVWPRRQRHLSEFVRIKPVFRGHRISNGLEKKKPWELVAAKVLFGDCQRVACMHAGDWRADRRTNR